MRVLLTVTVMLTCSGSSLAEEKLPFGGWLFPDAKLKQQVVSPLTVTSADKEHVQSVTSGLGQYITEKRSSNPISVNSTG